VFAAALLLLVPGLGRLGARETTDARYLEAAREMWASGDWLVPRLAGLPHLDKPPLAYWSGAAGFAALGTTPFAGRILQQLAVAATAVLVYRFGRQRIGARGAAAAAGVFLTSSLVFGASRALATDLFQLLFLTAALCALYDGAVQRSAGATAAGLACLGLSMWAKGPIALFVALAVVLPFLALARLRLPASGVALGAVLFLALGLPWYALLVARDPSLADYFVDRQLLSRATADGEGHVHGLLYLPFRGVLMGFLPWTPLVALVVWRLRPRRPLSRDPLELYLWLWTLAPLAFFELFPTKLPSYLLPCFPGAALLVGRALESARLDDRAGRIAIAASLGLAAVAAAMVAALVGLAVFAPARVERWLVPDELGAPFAFLAALAVATAGLAALALRALRRGVPLAAACAALGAGYLVGYNALAAPAPDHAADARIVRSVPGARVVQYGLFRPGLLFYLDDGAEHAVALRREFTERGAEPGGARLALRHEDVEAWMREDVPTFVLAKSSKANEVARDFDARTVRRTRHFALLANPAAARALPPDAAR
jgi:4-amino-4-deoxy-L-arabinose transferase